MTLHLDWLFNRRLKNALLYGLAISLTCLLGTESTYAQQQPRNQSKAIAYETRVYNVQDLLGPRNFPLPDQVGGTSVLGSATDGNSSNRQGQAGGFGGGFGGGAGNGQGGGMFRIPDHILPQICPEMGGGGMGGMGGGVLAGNSASADAKSAPITLATLQYVIQDTVRGTIESEDGITSDVMWFETDGEGGTISSVGSLLVINQRPDVHQQIDALLKLLRSQVVYAQPITLELVVVESEAVNQEDGFDVEKLVSSPEATAVRLTAMNGQIAHLISGVRQRVLTGAVPVVGGDGTGYQPQSTVQTLGIILESRCRVKPDSKLAEVDLHLEILSPSLDRANDHIQITSDLSGDRATAIGQQIVTTLVADQNAWKLAGSIPYIESGKHRFVVVRWK